MKQGMMILGLVLICTGCMTMQPSPQEQAQKAYYEEQLSVLVGEIQACFHKGYIEPTLVSEFKQSLRTKIPAFNLNAHEIDRKSEVFYNQADTSEYGCRITQVNIQDVILTENDRLGRVQRANDRYYQQQQQRQRDNKIKDNTVYCYHNGFGVRCL